MTYAGLGTERSSRVYGKFIVDQSAKHGRRSPFAKANDAQPSFTKSAKTKPADSKHTEAKPAVEEAAEATPEKGEWDE